MNSKRSYLDSLNDGRQRRPLASLDELNRSLENLEARLERQRNEQRESPADSYRAPPRQAPPAGYTPRGEYGRTAPYERPYQAIARDIDRARGQEDGVAAVGKIAVELRALREEMHHQMSTGLQREFDLLRKDIDRASQSGAVGSHAAELGLELERLSGAIHTLAERSDDKSVNTLRLELEQVRRSLGDLAREETVLSVDRRWDEFDRRWDEFADRMSADVRQRPEDPALAALAGRLEQINDAVNSLPESLSLRSIEDKVRTLAGAVDQFVRQRDSHGDEMFSLIDERLDEISRAIVASTVAAQTPHFNPEPFERIEVRIAALAHQIEEITSEQPTAEIIDRLNTLSERVDDIAQRSDIPEQAVERLTRQISLIADKIERTPAAPDAGLIFQGIEQRFDALADVFERRQGDAFEHGNVLFRDLERRLEDLGERLDRQSTQPAADHSGIMEAIDARFTAFAQRLETNRPDPSTELAMRGLEARLDDISNRLEISAAQVSSIDPDLIRGLEAQVSELSNHLARPGSPLPEFEDIRPRLEEIERSISGNHHALVEAARQAAEDAVRSFSGSATEAAAVAGLAQDLKALEALTRRSDERNGKTFEAIHDTLLKIVDRLGSIETSEAPAPVEAPPASVAELLSTTMLSPAPKLSLSETPSLEPEAPAPLPEAPHTFGRRASDRPDDDRPARSPAQAAAEAAAAVAALDGVRAEKKEQKPPRTSMLSGLARALTSKKAKPQPIAAEIAEPVVETPAPGMMLDAPLDPKIANRPLEPGSGAPDLNAIMRRVRDERGETVRANEPDASKSDFIAAARRAAQAAAAEADAAKRSSDLKGPVRALRIGDLIKSRRKSVLMAVGAVMLALAGMQLGKAFISDPIETASITVAPAASLPVKTASAVAPAKPVELAAAPVRNADKAETASAPAIGPEQIADASTDQVQADAALDQTSTQSIPAQPVTTETIKPSVTPAAFMPEAVGPEALRQAANAGDAKALYEMGSRYAEARGANADMKAASQWYEKAAELGFAPAQYRIGNMYEKGTGVERDAIKAKTWYQLAAAQGNASAMHNLAVLFAMGADGTVDNDSANRWFTSAAELGIKDSQFNLGILAAKGVGMKQNLEESYKWFAIVAKQGDKDAAAKRDEIAKALKPEQLKRAEETTALWQPKPLDPAANAVEVPAAWQDAPAANVDMKRAVQNIQAILNRNGYEAGKPDGMMGQKTKDAIMAFQKDNALAPTGNVDEPLVEALLARK
ncbi:localization factor PodJL [Aminobacter aminovorans]|uniref:Polar organelle development protein n=1 Tax=Aminobacter aminovorans TaxID=83263 RepID=A0A380WRB1_AMIAI|nr:SEL1-like repeat protein [Aminobacter aminovorans]TCS23533.1 localization factor PodJL [Aminobacter aminovorans]SUU91499.1 Polar organelle development protein [Aminobacter aminovorans]